MDTAYSVGDRVEKVCPECGEQTGHMVKSVTRYGRISRVICSGCGSVGTCKASDIVDPPDNRKEKAGTAYDQEATFKTGQVIQHGKFGRGKVVKVLSNRMIDVLFSDRVRRLVHSR